MELKKYFHNKIINNLITIGLGILLTSAFLTSLTLEFYIIATYAFIFVIYSFGFLILKATVKRVIKERHKLNKEWAFVVLSGFLAIGLAIIAYYNSNTFYRILALVFLILDLGVDYCLYRFVYLPKIFQDKRVKAEVLYFSWKTWGEMLEKGEDKEIVANLIVSAQTKSNYRLDSDTWGARFSNSKIYNDTAGENSSPDNNVDIPVSVINELKNSASIIVQAYEKKN